MITIDELKAKLGGMKTAVDDLRDALSIEASEKRLAELEALRSVLVRERRATAVLPLHGIEHKIRLSFELEQETGSSDGAGSPPRAKAADIL